MRRIVSLALIAILCVSLLSMTAFAANASATLTGPSTVRAGDTITLTFKMNGSGLLGAEMDAPTYDKSQLELVKKEQKIGGAWKAEFYDSRIVIYDDQQATPINKNTNIFSYTFKVKNLAVGTKITVSCTNVVLSDGKKDIPVGTASYSATIAEPLSKDNALKSLTVSNATISPAFNANTTDYTAEVPFEISKLDVKAVANDTKAKVNISSPNLTPNGITKVTVTVTAENGAKKTYTISVKRAQDPNYVASGNNNLSGISVVGFLLSPVFSAENTKYVIWLPYETENVQVSGTAADSRASVRVEGGEALTAGADNEIKVICIAEDGTEKIYTVIAKRATSHDGSTQPVKPTDPPAEPNPTEPSVTEPVTSPSTPDSVEPQVPTEQGKTDGISWWLLLPVGIVCLLAGMVMGILIDKKHLAKK